jgi:DNA-binding transcriptional LysR family regulator
MAELDDLALFAGVVEHGGFAAAERASGVPKSRLSRRVSALEADLGVRLLQRSTRRFSVTEVGQDVYRHARSMLDEARAAREAVARVSAQPRGLVRIAVPIAFAQGFFAQIMPAFLERHPAVQLQVHVNNRRVDVIEEGFDIALRVRLKLDDDGGLVVRPLGNTHKLLVASPAYLQRAGHPKHPRELRDHAILNASEEPHGQHWELQSSGGTIERIDLPVPRVTGFDFPLLLQLAEAGQGITLLPIMACAESLARGALLPVLQEWDHPMGICHIVYPSRRGMLPAVRAMVEHLVETMPARIADAHVGCRREQRVEHAAPVPAVPQAPAKRKPPIA